MENDALHLHLELFDAIPKHGTQRRLVMKFIRSLEELPFTPGDFTDKDTSLRTGQIKIIGDYAITYWGDHPVKTVMIVDIRAAD